MMRGPETGPALWWSSLTHGGLLIAPARLAEYFPDAPAVPSSFLADRLRRDLIRAQSADSSHLSTLLDTVLEEVIGLKASWWTKGSEVDARWSIKAITGETVKPRRVWHALTSTAAGSQSAADDFVLPVFVAEDASRDGNRLGVGRGRRPVSRVTEWLRRANVPVALLTNGRQWRLIHAGADYDAWCEWDTDLWFEEGRPGAQIVALRTLLSPDALTPPRTGKRPPLVDAILDSRRGQAELSSMLGERVRQAVERLIQESAQSLAAVDGTAPGQVSRRELYIAATRVVMRCVVVLFAEARDLLPRDNAIYHGGYGIQGLREQLARLAGGRADRLRHSHSAWPRLLALFDLVRRGSAHEALPIPAYGGALFEPGSAASRDGVLRAMTAFESPANMLSDYCIHQILELLTVSAVKVRQGKSSTWVSAPVDFSDLSSEYIGILYEGLLDFELRRAPADDAIVFLRVGDEPALPLSRLEAEMAPQRIKELFGKLKTSTKKMVAGGEDEAGEEHEAEGDDATGDEPEEAPGDTASALEEPAVTTSDNTAANDAEAGDDFARVVRERAGIWAEKVVKETKLVPYPKDDTDPVVRDRWNRAVEAQAKSLYRLILPGQWYLVRWGGTRKGAGTFYTRPQLAVPTVRRTLQPLCYRAVAEVADNTNELATVTEWTPRTPEAILALKVCDPAMGSASFLVSSLRYITDALVESLHAHARLVARPDGAIVKLADGLPLEHPSQETIPVPVDHPEFQDRLRARLKRHVVERCIYGVDLDPLAVELARMALWIETMDRRLPFGFLDHKLRWGNALVGTWFDRFQDYPVMAFDRDDAGDKNHTRFVNHYRTTDRGDRKGDVWTHAWKRMKDDVIKPAMRELIATFGPQYRMASILGENVTPESVHDEALAVFRALHELPVHEVAERERLYRERILGNAALEHLRQAFDTWCAIWFWPGDNLALLPLPSQFHDPSPEAREVVARVCEEHRFFHWEVEFPDVFTGPGSGFDAIVGNPPWEIQKPSSREFFSNIDPLYRTYGKQEALRTQVAYFQRETDTEHEWLAYSARFKSFSTWNKFVANPFGDPQAGDTRFGFSRSAGENVALHDGWRTQRASRSGYADPEHPFRHQGSADINTYKMFVEAARALLREDGFLGFITPSGIYTDKGSTQLRNLLLNRSRWVWLFGFINWNRIFAGVYYRFKFCVLIVQKGGQTAAIQSTFGRYDVEDWDRPERFALEYPREQVARFSPRSSSILEFRSGRDLAVLERIYRMSVLLSEVGPDGWHVSYAREFDMTNDSKLFPPRADWDRKGYRRNEYGVWIGQDGDVALPLYEGRMVGQFDFSEKGWVSGKGRTAQWREIPWDSKVIEPQYLIARDTVVDSGKGYFGPKVAFMSITSATNARTTISAYLNGFPANHSLGFLRSDTGSTRDCLILAGVLGSVVFDYGMRRRLGGLNLSEFLLWETSVPSRSRIRPVEGAFVRAVASLALPSSGFAREWLSLTDPEQSWRRLWAITQLERLRLRCVVDALSADLSGVGVDDLAWILRDCDHPRHFFGEYDSYRTMDPNGFWRVDKEQDPELRHTVLAQVALYDLQRLGLDAFVAQNGGEGWMIPETLRLADYGLGHDDRAKEHQPVAPRLGPRFLAWQLEQGVEESWEECARHAERIDALLGITSTPPSRVNEPPAARYVASAAPDLSGSQTTLFGETETPKKKRRR